MATSCFQSNFAKCLLQTAKVQLVQTPTGTVKIATTQQQQIGAQKVQQGGQTITVAQNNASQTLQVRRSLGRSCAR